MKLWALRMENSATKQPITGQIASHLDDRSSQQPGQEGASEGEVFSKWSWGVPGRRLEDRIRDLCARAVYEQGTEWSRTVSELQVAIQEHLLRLANTTALTLVGKPEVVRERRHT